MARSIHLSGYTDDSLREAIGNLSPDAFSRLTRHACPGVKVADEHKRDLGAALAAADAGFTVEQRPVMAVIDGDTAVEVPAHFANLRTDTWAPLGIVGKRYNPVQTIEQLGPVDALVSGGHATLESIRVADNGRRVQVGCLMDVTALERIDGSPDVLAHFGLFTAEHGGDESATGVLQTIRLECFNGMTSRGPKLAQYKVRKTKNAHAKLEEASRLHLGLRGDIANEVADFQAMARQRMTLEGFQTFAGELLAQVRGTIEDDATRAATRRDREVQELVELFTNGAGNDGTTLWDGYNSVTEWIDHQRTKKDTARFSFDSATAGAGNKVKVAARKLLTR